MTAAPLGARLTIKSASPGLNPLYGLSIKLDDYEVKGLRYLELSMADHEAPICRMDFIVSEFDVDLSVLTELNAKLDAWKEENERLKAEAQRATIDFGDPRPPNRQGR